MERDQDGRGVRLSHIMKIQCFSNKSNSARRACCQNTVQEIPSRYPKGLFKSCSLHIAYLNTDSWSSESTHLGHCANPYSPLKKKKYICTPPTLDLLYCGVCQGKLFHFEIQKPKHKVEPTHMESCSATLCIQRKKNIQGTNSQITTPTTTVPKIFF